MVNAPFSQCEIRLCAWLESFVADVYGDGLHSDTVVAGVDVTLRDTAAAPATTKYLAVEQASERDAELLAAPAVDDEIYGRLEGQ